MFANGHMLINQLGHESRRGEAEAVLAWCREAHVPHSVMRDIGRRGSNLLRSGAAVMHVVAHCRPCRW